ncbi:ALP1-like protein [Tanacetum coccineum]
MVIDPQSAAEYFNMKHSKAINVIERCFGLLKGHWKILASPFFFRITTQVRIILACYLLHNLIRRYMRVDPQELEQDEEAEIEHEEQLVEEACLSHIILTDEWYNFKDGLAHQMFNTWRETSNP